MKITKIRQSCEIAAQILRTVSRDLKKGRSEKEVAREIKKLARKLAGGCAFPPIVAFGRNSANPHHSPTARKLRKGDIVKIDLGVKFSGFCSDLTRTFFTAEPTKMQREVYTAVLAAQLLGIRKTKAGVRARDLDAAVRTFLARKGFAKNFVHSLGHGLGRQIHQLPRISPKSKTALKSDEVITIEPGVYLKNKFGVRIEDTILVKKTSAEILTQFPKTLASIKIKL